MKRRSLHSPIPPESESVTRFKSLLSPAEHELLLEELARPLRPGLRLNPLKTNIGMLNQWAERYEWNLLPVPFCNEGWWVESVKAPPSHTIHHRLGFYYLQDVASMLPVSLFDFKQGSSPLILDLAASPGGKTTHLISRTNDRGLIIANDSSPERITALRLVMQTWGGINTAVTRFPGENFGAWFPDTFDYVLLDAPCSMQSLRSLETHPIRPISDKEQKGLSHRQMRLLVSAIQALRVGGQVVYATCTLSPEEDEAVLDEMVRLFGNQICIENVSARLPHPAPGIVNDGSRTYDPAVLNAIRFWPHLYRTSGFFAALITKTALVPVSQRGSPKRSFDKTGFQQLRKGETRNLVNRLQNDYGYDLDTLLVNQALSLWKRQEVVYLLPEAWLSSFIQLPYQSVGMILGKDTAEGFSPSHEWVARFGLLFKSGILILDEDQVGNWLGGADIIDNFSPDLPKGATVVVMDTHGDLIGRGKILSDRLKNLLPRRLVQ